MRNIYLTNFEIHRLNNINHCEVFCFNCQTLYAYDKGIIIKYDEVNEELICNLWDALYAESREIPEAIDILYHIEKDLLYLILSNGDVVSIEENGSSSVVGFVEDGIKAAQWSPEQEVIALVNGVDNVIVLTNDFDPVSEVNLHGADFGEKQHITVGWGKKETQFHGSLGKYAAQAKPEEVLFENTNTEVRISWRGDAEYFVVSSRNPETNSRYLRVFSKNGTLQYTSEKISGLEECLDWCPSGNPIASTQKLPNKYNVCFFEKNGMQHGDFPLSLSINGSKVSEVLWSKDSRILAVVSSTTLENNGQNEVNNCAMTNQKSIQFFTVSNYKWYCKYTIHFSDLEMLLGSKWDHHKQNVFNILILKGKSVYFCKYSWVWVTNKTLGSHVQDESFVAVIDGPNIQLTAFKRGIVPPPMYSYAIKATSPVNSVAFAPDLSNDMLVYLSNGNVQIYKYSIKNNNSGISHELVGEINSLNSESQIVHNCQWLGPKKLIFGMKKLTDTVSKSFVKVISFKDSSSFAEYDEKDIPVQSTVAFVRVAKKRAFLYDNAGKLYSYDDNELCDITSKENPGVVDLEIIEKEEGNPFILTLDNSNRFYINSVLIFNNILSFHVHDKFILLTNMKHELLCINSDKDMLNNDLSSEIFKRKVERGSRIVTSVHKDMKVVLQMPRGNLECIQPRALSIYTVGKYLDELKYAEAFNLMRKQRINLNLIYDHNPTLFEKNVQTFISQIVDPQWLSLFISDLSDEDVTETMYALAYKVGKNEPSGKNTSKVDFVCHIVEMALSNMKNKEQYLIPLLTCHIKRNKIEFLEAALSILKNLKEQEMQGVKPVAVTFDDAFKYMLYLIDVDEVYKIALGMYDFELVVTVANKSHKDPKEYLTFLNDLRKLEPNYQKFTIDKYLKRYNKALTHLIKCEEGNVFNECLTFIKVHKLYKQALKLIPQNSERYKTVCIAYGEDLLKSHLYEEAGIMFCTAGLFENALDAYKKAGNWQEVLCCLRELKISGNELDSICEDLANNLVESKQFLNASTIYLDYLKDAEEGIKTLTNGKYFADAYRVCHLHNCTDLINRIIVPGILHHAKTSLVQIAEFRETFLRQSLRLQLVRKIKENEENKTDYDGESDIFSEVSSVTSRSCASSRGTNKTYRSAKNKRKHERKLLSLKEGSRYEHLALVTALHTLVTNCLNMMPEIREINKFLIKINNCELAEKLQNEYDELLSIIEKSKSEIWIPSLMQPKQNFGPEATSNKIAAVYMESEDVAPVLLNPKYAIPPEVSDKIKWKLEILKQ
ncbi:hypothetical protein RUM44_010326 [Polyplax serrata]|uniref:Elongator complex protein 1 n=1 Tax=Polyplax serrata TaxID=468196 RepID=A0ABR1AV80_POLSC